jgi:hypothetical protein
MRTAGRRQLAPKKIDGRLVGALIALPVALTGSPYRRVPPPGRPRSERGQGVGLPSGEAVARRLDETPLSCDEVGAAKVWLARRDAALGIHPAEADVRCGSNRLGPVGARIVGDVLVGLLNLDPASVRYTCA